MTILSFLALTAGHVFGQQIFTCPLGSTWNMATNVCDVNDNALYMLRNCPSIHGYNPSTQLCDRCLDSNCIECFEQATDRCFRCAAGYESNAMNGYQCVSNLINYNLCNVANCQTCFLNNMNQCQVCRAGFAPNSLGNACTLIVQPTVSSTEATTVAVTEAVTEAAPERVITDEEREEAATERVITDE